MGGFYRFLQRKLPELIGEWEQIRLERDSA